MLPQHTHHTDWTAELTESSPGSVPQRFTKQSLTRRSGVVVGAVVSFGAAAFVIRGFSRIWHPGLWGEDGTVFLQGQHNVGFTVMFEPYAGYLHFAPRLIAAFVDLVALPATPLLYVSTAILAYLALASLVLSERLAWLIPDPLGRAIVFALLCLIPILDEVYGNIANLIFVGGIGMFFILMSADPKTRGGVALEVVLVLSLGLSGPLAVMFAPLFVYRWIRNGRSLRSLAVLLTVASAAIVQFTVYLNSTRSGTDGGGTLGTFVRTVAYRVGGGWLYGTDDIVADPSAHRWVQVNTTVWMLSAGAVTCYILPKIAPMAWALFAVLLTAPIIAYGNMFLSSGFLLQRHLVTPTAIVLTLVVAVAFHRPATQWARILAAALLAVGVGAVASSFLLSAHQTSPRMDRVELCLDSSAPICLVPGNPEGWITRLEEANS